MVQESHVIHATSCSLCFEPDRYRHLACRCRSPAPLNTSLWYYLVGTSPLNTPIALLMGPSARLMGLITLSASCVALLCVPNLQDGYCHTNRPHIHHSTITTPMIMPANFSIATLFPELAIRPNLPALPLSDVEKLEKTSFYSSQLLHCPVPGSGP